MVTPSIYATRHRPRFTRLPKLSALLTNHQPSLSRTHGSFTWTQRLPEASVFSQKFQPSTRQAEKACCNIRAIASHFWCGTRKEGDQECRYNVKQWRVPLCI